MAVFPKSQSGIGDLAKTMMTGLCQHGDLYPSISPQTLDLLAAALESFDAAINEFAQAQTAAKNATVKKNSARQELEKQLKGVLYLAKYDCMNSPADLKYIGWGPRKEQCRSAISQPVAAGSTTSD